MPAWSDMQQAVFGHVADDSQGNLIVEALAGTGKTTTIVEALKHTYEDESCLIVAFNKAIAEEFKRRGLSDTTQATTLHSFGFSQLRRARRDTHLNDGYVREWVKELVGSDKKLYDVRSAMTSLVSAAKNTLTSGIEELDVLADTFGINVPGDYDRELFVVQAKGLLDDCRERWGDGRGGIDFDDMIWLPVARGIPIARFDRAFVDEAQDLNPPQIALVLKAGKRTVAVGDRHQAIYAFRGADEKALDKVRVALEASTLPLSVTYRCPLAVVREAQAIVPALQAAPEALEGIVRGGSYDDAIAHCKPGDAIVSRSNAPLISIFYTLLGLGKKSYIKGKDLGKDLAAWVRSSKAKSITDLELKIGKWQETECARLVDADRPFDHVVEKANCLRAIARHHSDIKSLLAALETMFAEGTYSEATHVTLSSTHKAKGLEWSRVWLLRDTYCNFPGPQEKNLLYVAITRSKHELVYCEKGEEL